MGFTPFGNRYTLDYVSRDKGWGWGTLFLPVGEVFNLEKIDAYVIKEHIFTEYELHLIGLYLCKYKVTLIGNRKLYEATLLLGHYQPLSL